MTFKQLLRIVRARKWLVILLFAIAAPAGIALVLMQPKQYIASSSLVVDSRPDPILGALAAPANMATQVEILRSDKVSTRVVKMLGVERSPGAVAQWREATGAKIPLDRYFAELLQNGLEVAPTRGSNVINISFVSQDPAFAAAAANAFAQAAMDTAVEMRVEPARQSVTFFDGQAKSLRASLEASQARLSKYQQDKGIVVTDERLDLENGRLSALTAQLALAQAERLDAVQRQRSSGSEMSPDVQQSGAVQGLKTQLVIAQTRLSEISGIVGTNHPQRQQLEAQIASLQRQLAVEVRRVSGGASVLSRSSEQKVNELQAMADAQKKQLLALRGERDQISVLMRDVETAQRAYDAVGQRMSQLNIESQTNQSMLRLLSPAVEPFTPSRKKLAVGIFGSLLGALLLGVAAAAGLELMNRKVRGIDDLRILHAVPVIGVLRPVSSREPIFRQLSGPVLLPRRALPLAGAAQ